MSQVYASSTTAPVNIAVIKYWGKRDAALNLPTNSSISVTLSQDDLRARTTVACSDSFKGDRMWLNAAERDTRSDSRLQACLRELRKLRSIEEGKDSKLPKLSLMDLHIASENNFPTAAGLASSAAGFAALVQAIADLYKLPASSIDLSRIARQGSGSACRSLFGGYVAWEMGKEADGSDSQAVQVATKEHWPEMRACILVASAQKKDTSSTSGMQSTTKTSSLFTERVTNIVPRHMSAMSEAIRARDFASFAELTMRDSNQFHAVCLDTYPPIFYMNDTSRAVVRLVEHINAEAGQTVSAYTYDAGPNTVIYYLKENEGIIAAHVKGALAESTQGIENLAAYTKRPVPDRLAEQIKIGITQVIMTEIGDGPRRIEESLLNAQGFPFEDETNETRDPVALS